MVAAPLEAFGGHYLLDNFVRLILCVVGITILTVCVKIGIQSWRLRRDDEERQRVWAIMGFALIIVAPAGGSLTQFDTPLPWSYAVLYLLGLFCSCVSLAYRISVSPPWLRWRADRRTGRETRGT